MEGLHNFDCRLVAFTQSTTALAVHVENQEWTAAAQSRDAILGVLVRETDSTLATVMVRTLTAHACPDYQAGATTGGASSDCLADRLRSSAGGDSEDFYRTLATRFLELLLSENARCHTFPVSGTDYGPGNPALTKCSTEKTSAVLHSLRTFSSFAPVMNSTNFHNVAMFLSHPHPHVRKAACDLLAQSQSAPLCQLLIGALAPLVDDPMPAVRSSAWVAVVAAYGIRPHEISESLFAKACRALQDEFASVRKAALKMIALWGRESGSSSSGTMPADEAFLHISTTATDMSRFVRQEGFRLLASLPVRGVTFSVLHLSLYKKVARSTRALQGNKGGEAKGEEEEDGDQALLESFAAGAFVHGLEDEFWQVRNEALHTLASLCQRCSNLVSPAVVHFVDALNDDNEVVRVRAMDGLLGLGEEGTMQMPEEQTQIVIRTLASASWRVRKGALQLLGRLKHCTEAALRGTVDALVEHMNKRSTDALCTLSSLAQLGESHGALLDAMWDQMQTQLRTSLASVHGLSSPTSTSLLVLLGSAACARPSLEKRLPPKMWGHLRLLKRKVPGNYLDGGGGVRQKMGRWVGGSLSGEARKEGVGWGVGLGRGEPGEPEEPEEPSEVAEAIERSLTTAFGVGVLVEGGGGEEASNLLRRCKAQLERIQSGHVAAGAAARLAVLQVEVLEGVLEFQVRGSAGKAERQKAGGRIESALLRMSAQYQNLGVEQQLGLLELRLVAATCRLLQPHTEGRGVGPAATSAADVEGADASRDWKTCSKLVGDTRSFCDSHGLPLPPFVHSMHLATQVNTTAIASATSGLARYWPVRTKCDGPVTRTWGDIRTPSLTSRKAMEFVQGFPLSVFVEAVVYNLKARDRLWVSIEFSADDLGVEYRFVDWTNDDVEGVEFGQEPPFENVPIGAVTRCSIQKSFVLYKVPSVPFSLRLGLGIESNLEEFNDCVTQTRAHINIVGKWGPKNVVVPISAYSQVQYSSQGSVAAKQASGRVAK